MVRTVPLTDTATPPRWYIFANTGVGKSTFAQEAATALGYRIAVIDSQAGDSRRALWGNRFTPVEGSELYILESDHPLHYLEVLHQVIEENATKQFDCLIVDDLTMAYSGEQGFLALADEEVAYLQSKEQERYDRRLKAARAMGWNPPPPPRVIDPDDRQRWTRPKQWHSRLFTALLRWPGALFCVFDAKDIMKGIDKKDDKDKKRAKLAEIEDVMWGDYMPETDPKMCKWFGLGIYLEKHARRNAPPVVSGLVVKSGYAEAPIGTQIDGDVATLLVERLRNRLPVGEDLHEQGRAIAPRNRFADPDPIEREERDEIEEPPAPRRESREAPRPDEPQVDPTLGDVINLTGFLAVMRKLIPHDANRTKALRAIVQHATGQEAPRSILQVEDLIGKLTAETAPVIRYLLRQYKLITKDEGREGDQIAFSTTEYAALMHHLDPPEDVLPTEEQIAAVDTAPAPALNGAVGVKIDLAKLERADPDHLINMLTQDHLSDQHSARADYLWTQLAQLSNHGDIDAEKIQAEHWSVAMLRASAAQWAGLPEDQRFPWSDVEIERFLKDCATSAQPAAGAIKTKVTRGRK